MIEHLAQQTLVQARMLKTVTRSLLARSRSGRTKGDEGMGTLEVVILAIGLMAAAALLIAAITAAVTRRTAQIN